MSETITTHELELEGTTFIVQKKRSTLADGQFLTHYSLDNSATWHSALTNAYMTAKKDGTLTKVGEPLTEGGEFESFLLALVEKLTGMEQGERLILVKTDTQVVVLKESVVLAVSASAISDVDLRMTSEDKP